MHKALHVLWSCSGVLRSSWAILRCVVKRQAYEVIFYYPRHFNTSEKGRNPFFDPLAESLAKRQIRYLVIEGGRLQAGSSHNPQALRFDFPLAVITVCQRIARALSNRRVGTDDIEAFLGSPLSGRIFNALTLGAFRAPVYVTISMAQVAFWRAVNPRARLFDMQHGQITPSHYVYFDGEHNVRSCFRQLGAQVFLFGEGFKKSFEVSPVSRAFMESSVWVLGDPRPKRLESPVSDPAAGGRRRTVLFSVQFSNEIVSRGISGLMGADTLALVQAFSELHAKHGFQLLFKLKAGSLRPKELEGFEARFPFVSFTERPLHEVCQDAFYHITFYSTVAFDVAQWGLPTYFICTPNFPEGRAFADVLGYPDREPSLIAAVSRYVENRPAYAALSRQVKDWYGQCYSDYDESVFLQAIGKGRGEE